MSQFHYLYNSRKWRKRRAVQLMSQPLCEMCLRIGGRVKEATVADHVIPHKGDLNLFYNGKLQSLCDDCHNRFKKHIEHGHKHELIGKNGWPTEIRG